MRTIPIDVRSGAFVPEGVSVCARFHSCAKCLNACSFGEIIVNGKGYLLWPTSAFGHRSPRTLVIDVCCECAIMDFVLVVRVERMCRCV